LVSLESALLVEILYSKVASGSAVSSALFCNAFQSVSLTTR
jgi:hypothetical protein